MSDVQAQPEDEFAHVTRAVPPQSMLSHQVLAERCGRLQTLPASEIPSIYEGNISRPQQNAIRAEVARRIREARAPAPLTRELALQGASGGGRGFFSGGSVLSSGEAVIVGGGGAGYPAGVATGGGGGSSSLFTVTARPPVQPVATTAQRKTLMEALLALVDEGEDSKVTDLLARNPQFFDRMAALVKVEEEKNTKTSALYGHGKRKIQI